MIVDPYKRHPEPPTVAVLLADERDGFRIVDERGRRWRPDELTPQERVRVWGSYDVVHELVAGGVGEALCWNNEEVRWRHDRLDPDGWRQRASDVSVLKIPFPADHRETLRALGMWRDWLGSYGAAPVGTAGSAAWSLLRARLERRLWTTQPKGQLPPVPWTLGGRQALGPAGPGRFDGDLEQWDMPAAYAAELGGLSYGGFWSSSSNLPKRPLDPEWWSRSGRPTFARVRVSVPELPYGPLPRRPRKRLSGMAAAFLGAEYPVGRRVQGVWTWQEVAAAVEAGCRLERVLEVWVHFASSRPFAPWWDAVQAGRQMPALAGVLAKMAGNALWGRFCMDSTGGKRTIRGRQGGRLVQRRVVSHGGIPAAHDLAETVSGRVRARLYLAMLEAGEGLLSAHTDGVWLDLERLEGFPDRAAWRRKGGARRLDLLDPQVLRYWPPKLHEQEPFHVFAGMPAEQAPRVFEELWRDAGFEPELELEHERELAPELGSRRAGEFALSTRGVVTRG